MNQLQKVLLTAFLSGGLTAACVEQQEVRQEVAAEFGRAAAVEDLFIVDCLLPGQVRKLGSQMTYLSARRPIQTTAQDCEIRGGEYVAYDRANYATALQVWLPAAQEGDADAQNKVGEIYEKGLGGTADFEMAALWYKRAAEQGFGRAQINLGFLYEKGLGVPKNLKTALEWYRKGSKLPDAVVIDKTELDAMRQELVSLKSHLDSSRDELERARQDEQRLQKERNRLLQEMKKRRASANSATNQQPIEQIRSEMARQQRELAQRQEVIRSLETTSKRQRERLLLLETEGGVLKDQLAVVRTQLSRSQEDLQHYQKLTEDSVKQLRQTQEDLAALAGKQENVVYARVQDLEGQLQQREQALAAEREAAQRLQRRTEELQGKLAAAGNTDQAELAATKQRLAQAEAELARSQTDITQKERQLAAAQAQLLTQKNEAQAKIQAIEAELRNQRQALTAHTQKVQGLENQLSTTDSSKTAEVAALRQQLAAAQTDLSQAEQQVGKYADELTTVREQMLHYQQLTEQSVKKLELTSAELVAKSQMADAESVRLQELENQLKERERLLQEHQQMVEQLRRESEQWQEKLVQLEKKSGQVAEQPKLLAARNNGDEVPLMPPSIQLIEPPLIAVRSSEMTVPIKRGLKRRTVVGQVSAAAGLYALTINGAKIVPDDKGLFESDIRVVGESTPVNMVAIDKQGKRASLSFNLVTEAGSDTLVAKVENLLQDVEIGKYHALVIGNMEYEYLPDLDTSGNDAKTVAEILKEKFGFETTLLLNATRYQILSEMNRLRKTLTEKDNLVLYYAGHGELDRVNLRGHWLPVDAELHSTANWISNVAITDVLNAMSVRHVLVVADSCYSGALTRSSLANIDAGESNDTRSHWLKTIAKMRSRTVLSSGGLAPVLDGGGGSHSVFAKAFLGVLRDLDEIAEGQKIYREVAARVAFEANRYQVEQIPEYAPIKFAGHESGDFLFVPASLFN
jgi:hypothetical protein